MKFLLIYPNRVRTFMPAGPIGISYLLSNLDQQRHPARALDMMFQEYPAKAIRDAILEFRPEVIGLSIRNFDELDMASCTCYLPEVKEVVELIRENSREPLVLGGVGFTVMHKQLMAYLQADFGIIGEGEHVFPELLNRLESSKDYKDLPASSSRKRASLELIHSPGLKIWMESILQIAPLWTYNNMPRYRGFIGVISKKGCPQGCIWCPSPYYPGRKITLREGREDRG